MECTKSFNALTNQYVSRNVVEWSSIPQLTAANCASSDNNTLDNKSISNPKARFFCAKLIFIDVFFRGLLLPHCAQVLAYGCAGGCHIFFFFVLALEPSLFLLSEFLLFFLNLSSTFFFILDVNDPFRSMAPC